MSKKCPICGRCAGAYQDYVGGTSFFKCEICGHTGCDFEDATLFDRITESPEALADFFVFRDFVTGMWTSLLDTEEKTKYKEAVAAVVAKLKEVENENF